MPAIPEYLPVHRQLLALSNIHYQSSHFFKRHFHPILNKYPVFIKNLHNNDKLKEITDGFYSDLTSLTSLSDRIERLGDYYDLEFVRAWVSARSTHQLHGRMRLLSDLRKKGISPEVAGPVIDDCLGFDQEVAIARKAAEKKYRTLRVSGMKGRDAVYRYLRSRGFSSRIIQMVS